MFEHQVNACRGDRVKVYTKSNTVVLDGILHRLDDNTYEVIGGLRYGRFDVRTVIAIDDEDPAHPVIHTHDSE